MRPLLATPLVAVFVLACSGASVPTSTPAPASVSATRLATAELSAPTPTAQATTTPFAHVPGITLLDTGCQSDVARCIDMPAGTYETSGTWAFLRGLRVTLPPGWSSGEQDAGEFELHQASDVNAGSEIYFWHDVVPWVDGAARPELATSAESLADYLLSDSRLVVAEGAGRTFTVGSPESLQDAGTVQARSFSVILSDSARTEPNGAFFDCPADACVGFLTDLLHWDGGQAALTRGDSGCDPECSQAMRLFILSIGPQNHPELRAHTLVVALSTYGTDPLAALSAWEAHTDQIVDSVRVPFIIVDN